MKISFIEPHLKIYGGIRRIVELANRLTERGHDVTVFHSDGSPCNWMACIAKVKSYDEVLKEDYDVVVYNDPNPIDYELVRKARAKLKVFYVLELYDKELLKGIKPRIYLPRNTRMLILKKSLCSPYLKLVNASWEKEWLRENMNIDSKLLLGGVNFEIFHPIEVRKNRNEIAILSSGDPRERKGAKTIIEAVQIAKREEPRIALDTYHGKGITQEQMGEKYSSADIFVEGSWHAGWNNPVAEAMACKVPVVCSDIGGVKDFAFHEKTALLVPPKNAEAMASAILRLVRDEELRECLRDNAYKYISKFDWDKTMRKLEEILAHEIGKANFKKSYIGPRDDILGQVPHAVSKVLDIGCSVGTLGAQLKQRFGAEVVGVEIDERMAEIAKEKIDQVIVGNIEEINVAGHFAPEYFDCIVFADVLEHLKDPWSALKHLMGLLSNKGILIASIPNVRHYSTIVSLLVKGYWPYRARGIHDKTHLRFFTLRNIVQLFEYANVEIVKIKRNYRIIEKPHSINRYAKLLAVPFIREFITFQYVISAKKRKT